MRNLYVDSSALLRVLFDEPGDRLPLRGAVAASSRILEVECLRALDRVRLSGQVNDDETAKKHKELSMLFANFHWVNVSDEVIALAKNTFPVPVRALDALHVASAQLLVNAVGPLEFWTHDVRQANAALARGLEVRGT